MVSYMSDTDLVFSASQDPMLTFLESMPIYPNCEAFFREVPPVERGRALWRGTHLGVLIRVHLQ